MSDQVTLLQDRLTDVRKVAAELHPREAAERVVRLREHIPDHETRDLLRDDERVRGDLLHPRRQIVVQRLLQVAPDTFVVTQQIERFVIRDVFAQSYYPFSRFTRVEFGGHFSNISQAILQQGNLVAHDPGSGQNFLLGVGDPVTVNGPSVSFYGPTVAVAHDNALGGWVGRLGGFGGSLGAFTQLGDRVSRHRRVRAGRG